MRAAEIAGRFKGVAQHAGGHYRALCPAHEDRTASLFFKDGNVRVMFHCFTHECPEELIVQAVGLTMGDLLFTDGNGSSPKMRTNTVTITLAKPDWGAGRIVDTYDYRDEAGTLLYQKLCAQPQTVRRFIRDRAGTLLSQEECYQPETVRTRRPDGEGGWIWNLKGVRRVVYKLDQIRARLAAQTTGQKEAVLVVEGEEDADFLWEEGLCATNNDDGAGTWSDDLTRQLVTAGAEAVEIYQGHDEARRKHAEAVAASCHAAGLEVEVRLWPPVPEMGGDVSDYLDAGHTTAEQLARVSEPPEDGVAVLELVPPPPPEPKEGWTPEALRATLAVRAAFGDAEIVALAPRRSVGSMRPPASPREALTPPVPRPPVPVRDLIEEYRATLSALWERPFDFLKGQMKGESAQAHEARLRRWHQADLADARDLLAKESRLRDELGPAFAAAVRREHARWWAAIMGRCPRCPHCGRENVMHDPDSGAEISLE